MAMTVKMAHRDLLNENKQPTPHKLKETLDMVHLSMSMHKKPPF